MLLDLKKLTDVFKLNYRGVFHVGAHFGQEIDLYESLRIPKVVMFEASKKNFNILGKNVEKRATIVNKALGSKAGFATLNVEANNEGMSNSLLSPSAHLAQYPHITFNDTEEVEITTLDEWCEENVEFRDCNLMSIDVQGFELEVLLGSKKVLTQVDCVICEVNRADLYKDCAQVIELDIYLRNFGFRRVATNWEGQSWGDACYVKEHILNSIGGAMPTVGLVDSNFSHSKSALGFDSACLLPTARFDWNRDLKENEDLVVFVDGEISKSQEIKSKHKVAWLIEPREVNPLLSQQALALAKNFDAIMTHDKDLISKLTNGVFVPIGGTWIKPEDWGVHEKTKRVSIIASRKSYASGHSLRHSAASLISEEDRFGGAHRKIENKIEALSSYKYSVTIENCRQRGFFTEKIIDSLIVGTIPIYWGCPDIGEFFDERGIITFENVEDLSKILESDLDSYYESVKSIVESNAKKARRFASCDELLFNTIAGVC
jgi:FkbM family methyltransferase